MSTKTDSGADTTAPSLDTMIVRTPGTIGGKPRIAGTRIGVHRLAGWWKMGLTEDEIHDRVPSLTMAEIFVGLAYYQLHREEIEGYLDDEEQAAQSLLKRKRPTRA
ncbi:MAG: DUF433 domain-containing protein [Verrucomicrobiota bacterium]|nr:DUF433 domain-containing protein [Verrucomicrobiota bacterium]